MESSQSAMRGSSGIVRAIVGVFGIVLLGAIGSGLWDVALSPLLEMVGNVLLRLASRTFESFADSMYRGVSRNPALSLAVLPYAAVLSAALVVPWGLTWMYWGMLARMIARLNEDAEGSGVSSRAAFRTKVPTLKRIGYAMVPMALTITLVYAATFYRDAYTLRAATFVERSIAILAPHVAAEQTLRANAAFRAVENAHDFYALEDSLRATAAQVGVTLPEFQSIR